MIEVLAARASWCAPDERILWCHPLTREAGKFVLYAVPGLDDFGERSNTSRKVAEAVTGVGALFLEAFLAGGESTADSAYGKSVPWAVVSGKDRDCLAVSCLSDWRSGGGNSSSRDDQELCWVLTTHRLGLLDFAEGGKTPDAKPASGVFGGLKKTVGTVWGSRDPEGRGTSLPTPQVCAEITRNAIASVEVVKRKMQGRVRHWFTLRLSDGSMLYLSDRKYHHEPMFFDRMLAMTHGQE